VFVTNQSQKIQKKNINHLGRRLEHHGHTTIYAEGEVDYSIPIQANPFTEQNTVTVVGVDTLVRHSYFTVPLL
jgi:hypothetical protein